MLQGPHEGINHRNINKKLKRLERNLQLPFKSLQNLKNKYFLQNVINFSKDFVSSSHLHALPVIMAIQIIL